MTGWIIAGIVVAVLIITACMMMSGRESRKEALKAIREFEELHLAPCPVCGQTPHLGYCCGEYVVYGDNPKCPCCGGTNFLAMHSDPRLEVEAWNRWVLYLRCGVGVFPADQASEAGEVQGNG